MDETKSFACLTNKKISNEITISVNIQHVNCNTFEGRNSLDKIEGEVDNLIIGINTVGKQTLYFK